MRTLCPSCGLEMSIRGSAHDVPIHGEPCPHCDSFLLTSCTVGPGHTISICEEGHRIEDVGKLTQRCPKCHGTMFFEEATTDGRYVYRCDENSKHVKLEAECSELPPASDYDPWGP